MRKLLASSLCALLFLSFSSVALAQDEEEFGMASYYHESFHGNETAYGVEYDKNKLTAAHRLHPYGTRLRVTRLDNKKSVVVKVTDKGPYVRGRIIDLSKAAAERIGLLEDGVTEVKVEVLERGESRSRSSVSESRSSRQGSDERPESYEPRESQRITREDEQRSAERAARREAAEQREEAQASKAEKSESEPGERRADTQEKGGAAVRLVSKNYQKYGLYKIALKKPNPQGYAVQVASLTNYENVFQQVADLQSKWFDNILISIEEGRIAPTYKIMLGPFKEEAAALNYRKNLLKKHKIKGFVVDLSTIKFTR